jgi:hypothetical protein
MDSFHLAPEALSPTIASWAGVFYCFLAVSMDLVVPISCWMFCPQLLRHGRGGGVLLDGGCLMSLRDRHGKKDLTIRGEHGMVPKKSVLYVFRRFLELVMEAGLDADDVVKVSRGAFRKYAEESMACAQLHGFSWFPEDFYCSTLIFLFFDFYIISLNVNDLVDLCRSWSTLVDICGHWSTIVDPLSTFVDICRTWSTMVGHGRPWLFLVDLRRP